MGSRKRTILKIEITLLVFIAILTALTLTFVKTGDGGTDTDRSVLTPDSHAVTATEPPGTTGTVSTVTDTAIEPDPPPIEEPEDPYVTLQLDKSDIATGDLILVNPNNYYEPADSLALVSVAENKTRSYVLLDNGAKLAEKIMTPLNAMMDEFYEATGLTNVVLNSTFRTLERQKAVLVDWIERVGQEEAERIAAKPGHSEHHTGMAFDLALIYDGELATFKGTGKYEWIHENAHKYGFILRYPESKQDITKTAYEPWHFRYIGIPHAYLLEKKDMAFEEYIKYLAGFPFDGTHMQVEYDGAAYEIYYVSGTSVPVPKDYDYTISGNNIDGFIVTVNLNGTVEY